MMISKHTFKICNLPCEKLKLLAIALLSIHLFSVVAQAETKWEEFVPSLNKIQTTFNSQISELDKKLNDSNADITNQLISIQSELSNVALFSLDSTENQLTILKAVERIKNRISYTAKQLSTLTEQLKTQQSAVSSEQINQIQKSIPEQISFLNEEIQTLESLRTESKSMFTANSFNIAFYLMGALALILLAALISTFRALQQARGENSFYLQKMGQQDHSFQDSIKRLKKLKSTSEQSFSEMSDLDHQIHDLIAHENIDDVKRLIEASELVTDMLQTQRSLIYRAVATASADSENLAVITDLVKFVEEISSKTKVIHDIAFKTKVLSFNASVEAERAGARGRGFSVVAQEMKRLAEISGKAAEDIGSIVERTRRSTQVLASADPRQDRTAHSSLLEAEANVEKLQDKISDLKGQLTTIMQQRDLTQRNFEQVTRLIQQITAAQDKIKDLNEDIIQQQTEQQINLAS